MIPDGVETPTFVSQHAISSGELHTVVDADMQDIAGHIANDSVKPEEEHECD